MQASSIIGDAMYQQLNMSFTFDQIHHDKLVIHALADAIQYQLEMRKNIDLDLQQVKHALLSKHFKLVSKSPESLKIKISFVSLEFKSIEKITLNTLKQNLAEITIELKEESKKNSLLQNEMKDFKTQLRLMKEQMADLKRQNNKSNKQLIEVKLSLKETQQRLQKLLEQQNNKLIEKQIKRVDNKKQIEKQQMNKDKLEQEKINQHELTQKIKSQNNKYHFSHVNKQYRITLQHKNTQASIQSSWDGLVMVEGVVFDTGSLIRFRIQSISQNVAVGLAIKKVIIGNSYMINNENDIGHGCFLVSSRGISSSHLDKKINRVKNDFGYIEGDVVKVLTNGNELLFTNETTKRSFKMKVKLMEQQWSQACFCVRLSNSSVQIVK